MARAPWWRITWKWRVCSMMLGRTSASSERKSRTYLHILIYNCHTCKKYKKKFSVLILCIFTVNTLFCLGTYFSNLLFFKSIVMHWITMIKIASSKEIPKEGFLQILHVIPCVWLRIYCKWLSLSSLLQYILKGLISIWFTHICLNCCALWMLQPIEMSFGNRSRKREKLKSSMIGKF